MLSVMAHELAEAASDPSNIRAWNDAAGAENGDMCAYTYGTTKTEPNGSSSNCGWNGRRFMIQQNWDPETQSCTMGSATKPGPNHSSVTTTTTTEVPTTTTTTTEVPTTTTTTTEVPVITTTTTEVPVITTTTEVPVITTGVPETTTNAPAPSATAGCDVWDICCIYVGRNCDA
ncbi:hypothetical protein QVD99_002823 [Batrachochytrium dendrobatidis]|nr:hypothetical protein QVD99_002823 [Batrachochytrium dendrobatidis]